MARHPSRAVTAPDQNCQIRRSSGIHLFASASPGGALANSVTQAANDRLCAGFRTPAALTSPHARLAGVRKAPRHEIASGGSAWAVPQGIAEQEGYGDLGTRVRVGIWESDVCRDDFIVQSEQSVRASWRE